MRRRRGSGMERWMDGRERDLFYITIAFLEDSFCRGKRRSENGEREREREAQEKRKNNKNMRARSAC
jgi:TfoX/Sxy family transcriptional regulator of competence genes